MASPGNAGTGRRRTPSKVPRAQKSNPVGPAGSGWGAIGSILALLLGTALVYAVFEFHANYAISLQAPVKIRFESPLVIARRTDTPDAYQAQVDQKHPLTVYQQYACQKFGSACRVALAIQRAENPQGSCETYHYNSDGTLDWGYFQINTVHLKRPGVVLRTLLDCRANIDFAYLLFIEDHGFKAWSTYNSGAYRKFLRN